MQRHTLHALLAVDAQQRQPGIGQRDLLLRDGAQIGVADAVARLLQCQRARLLGGGAFENLRARCQRGLVGQGALDLVERPLRRQRPLSRRGLLLGGAQFDLRLQLAGVEQRPQQRGAEAVGRIVALLQHEDAARQPRDGRAERDARQLRRLRLADAVERGGDSALRRDHVGPALEQLGRHARDRRRRQRREGAGQRDLGRGVASEQHLERTPRLLDRQFHLPLAVAQRLDVGARDGHVQFGAGPDALALFGQRHELLRCGDHLGEQRALLHRFGGEEPGLRERRHDRLLRRAVVVLRRRVLRLDRALPVSQPAPHVDLPAGADHGARELARAAGGVALRARREIDARVQVAVGDAHRRCGLLDARRRQAQVQVVGDGLVGEKQQRRVVEALEPALAHHAGRAAGEVGRRHGQVREFGLHEVVARRWRRERAAGDEQRQRRQQQVACGSHQCSLSTSTSSFAPTRRMTLRRMWIASTLSV